jgi:probable phosphoglycerate mutase
VATLVLLVRHAHHRLIGRALAGRMPGLSLSPAGFRQALQLAERLAGERIARVQSSPRLRARQTARPLANALELPMEIASAVDEIDVGGWTGRAFDDLANDPDWRLWNARRGTARPPGGESMREAQQRILRHLAGISHACPDERVAIVGHAEPIRAAILHFRGLPLDDFTSVEVGPASVTRILVDGRRGELVSENEPLATLEAA